MLEYILISRRADITEKLNRKLIMSTIMICREVKDRQKAAKKTAALANKGAAGGSNAPKVQKGSAANSRGGSRR